MAYGPSYIVCATALHVCGCEVDGSDHRACHKARAGLRLLSMWQSQVVVVAKHLLANPAKTPYIRSLSQKSVHVLRNIGKRPGSSKKEDEAEDLMKDPFFDAKVELPTRTSEQLCFATIRIDIGEHLL